MNRESETRRRRAPHSNPPVRSCRWLAGALSLVILGHVPGGGDARIPTLGAGQDRPTFRAAVERVLLQASVLDAEGEPVGSLRKHDFTVYEDGVPQTITFFEENAAADPVPAAIALLADTSSSMEGGELVQARKAALKFLSEVPGHAELAIVGFDGETRVLCPFTRERESLVASVNRLHPGGGTALYDALREAIDLLESSGMPRQVLTVLSDGVDLDSVTPFPEVLERLQTSPVVVYSVGYYSTDDGALFRDPRKYYKAPPIDENLNPAWVLREVSRVSGGRAFFLEEAAELEDLFGGIARVIRHQYLLGYSPPPAGDGKPRFRKVEVRVERPPSDGPPPTVRARPGYVR